MREEGHDEEVKPDHDSEEIMYIGEREEKKWGCQIVVKRHGHKYCGYGRGNDQSLERNFASASPGEAPIVGVARVLVWRN